MSVIDVALAPLRREIARLREALDTKPTLRLGTITASSQIRVHLDGDTAPLPVTPRTLISPVSVGDRVLVAHQKRAITILGRLGG